MAKMVSTVLLLSALVLVIVQSGGGLYDVNYDNSALAAQSQTKNSVASPRAFVLQIAVDKTAPSVTITTPATGSTVLVGTIAVQGTASDSGSGMKIVYVKVDNSSYKTATPKAPGDWSTWSVTVNIATTGSHKIVAKAYDNAGNFAWARSYITVVSSVGTNDTTPPSITAPPDIVAEATGPLTTVSLGTPTVSDLVDPSPTVTNNAPSAFPAGTTIVTWTAKDYSGNSASDTQLVTIKDTAPPSITAPADITAEATGPLTTVSLGTPTVSDLVDPSPTVTNNAPTNGFPVGTTIITWTATDDSGNSASDTQLVTIKDTTPPSVTITAPSNASTIPIGTIAVQGTASDSGSGVKTVSVKVDDGPYTTATPKAPGDWSTWSTTVSIITTGSHSIIAQVYDYAGNYDEKTLSIDTVVSDPNNDDDLPAPLRIVEVSSISTLMDAIAAAKPGDHIILKNGIYDTTSWLTAHSAKTLLITAKGTQQAPIVITAETIGGAEITGPAGFQFNGASYLIIRGFKFSHSQDNSQYSDDIAIRCQNCKYVRFTQNHFQLTTTLNGQSDWLGLRSGSDHNRVDHNTFAYKNTLGTFLLILGSYYDRIDHNYFLSQTYSSGNGGECMRIGNSQNALTKYYATVELNLFEQCNGDREAITVKSSNNILRWNTFRNNAGSLTLRHGNDNLVDGNFFLYGQNGVRLYGHNHIIINNYFEGNFGQTVRTTLVVGSGTVSEDLTTSNSEHSQPQNIIIAFNTFINNITNMIIGYGSGTLPPTNVKISHNILQADSGDLVTVLKGENLTWEANILFGKAKPGNLPQTGYTWIDPMLVLENDGVYRIANISPAIDKADPNNYPYIIVDMDGQQRLGKLDSGADEYTTEPIIRKPLLPSDVGPNGL